MEYIQSGRVKARCMTVAQVERAGVTKEIVEAQVGLEPDSEESSSHECLRGNILEMTITRKRHRDRTVHSLVGSVTVKKEPRSPKQEEILGDGQVNLCVWLWTEVLAPASERFDLSMLVRAWGSSHLAVAELMRIPGDTQQDLRDYVIRTQAPES